MMNTAQERNVLTLGLFEKRMPGDDCLLELARQRFLDAQMGAEIHAATPDQLDWLMRFRPWDNAPVVIHLPRDFDLLDENHQRRILDLATHSAGKVSGIVLHDRHSMVARRNDHIDAAWKLDSQLEKIKGGPTLFIEYAVGLEPGDFARFFSSILDLGAISACIDIGHVGIRAARQAYARKHPGEDICALKSQPARIPSFITEIEAAVAGGAAVVLDLVEVICAMKRPVHFHLHDAHPLSTFSPFGLSDHLSFFSEIPISFEHHGRRAVPLMFGPESLSRIVTRTLELMGPRRASFTLEIHPTQERLPLGDAAELFEHWTDKTNAEQMNHWLSVLTRNHLLLKQAIQPTPAQGSAPAASGVDSETACLI
jgi:hypothetical protein